MAPRLPEPGRSNGSSANQEPTSAWQQLWALVRQRCPRCRKGHLFRGWFGMNDPCPVCGLVIQREEGYFLGAMYVSYLLGVVLLGGGYFLGTWLLPNWHDHAILVGLFLLYLPLTPVVFRYSRTIWIYVDRLICPTDISAGSFEKTQTREIKRPSGDESSPDGAVKPP